MWIDIPKDVQTESIELSEWPSPLSTAIAPAPDPLAVTRAADLINQAARPVLYLGGGTVHSPGAAPLALALAELASLPTTMTLMALGVLPADHPLSLGMLGMHAARHTNLVLEECDLLIAVGARFDDRATGNPKHFCTAANGAIRAMRQCVQSLPSWDSRDRAHCKGKPPRRTKSLEVSVS